MVGDSEGCPTFETTEDNIITVNKGHSTQCFQPLKIIAGAVI